MLSNYDYISKFIDMLMNCIGFVSILKGLEPSKNLVENPVENLVEPSRKPSRT